MSPVIVANESAPATDIAFEGGIPGDPWGRPGDNHREDTP
jgi:hypothetical protein